MSERNKLPAEAFLNPENFGTAFDVSPSEADKRYHYGRTTGEQAQEITIAINGAWGAKMKTGGLLSASERIGHHAYTAALLRGFLDSGCAVTVYREVEGRIVPTTICGEAPIADNVKEKLADDAFASYDFREDDLDGRTEVVDADSGWDRSDPGDWIKVCYVKFLSDPDEADSRKVSFHVKFAGGKVSEAYALDAESGNEIGLPYAAPESTEDATPAKRPTSTCGM